MEFNGLKNLSKGNFWNKIETDFPLAMKAFHLWIDEYKQAVDWEILFNAGWHKGVSTSFDSHGHPLSHVTKHQTPKFHNLPYEMQIGILIRFFDDTTKLSHFDGVNGFVYTDRLLNEPIPYLTESFEEIERVINFLNKTTI